MTATKAKAPRIEPRKAEPPEAGALSREKIAATGISIGDAGGFASVSMRRIADELGVGTMSLYHYVKNKADLVAAMDDVLMAEVLLPSVPKNWRAALLAISTRTRDALVRHPWMISSMQSAPPGVNAMRHMEQCLKALAKTSLNTRQKFVLLSMMDDFVFGYALREAARETKVDGGFVKSQLDTGAFPRIAEALRKVPARAPAMPDRFRLGLKRLLGKKGPNPF